MLGEKWVGDSEAKAALLQAVFGVPEQHILPELGRFVRRRAIVALGRGWSGDSEVKAAFLRAAIEVPEQEIVPDQDIDVLRLADSILSYGCRETIM